jgi:hypothetical protein
MPDRRFPGPGDRIPGVTRSNDDFRRAIEKSLHKPGGPIDRMTRQFERQSKPPRKIKKNEKKITHRNSKPR